MKLRSITYRGKGELVKLTYRLSREKKAVFFGTVVRHNPMGIVLNGGFPKDLSVGEEFIESIVPADLREILKEANTRKNPPPTIPDKAA